jgi:hypothetical protein
MNKTKMHQSLKRKNGSNHEKGMDLTKSVFSFFILLSITYVSFSQKVDSTKVASHFGGTIC